MSKKRMRSFRLEDWMFDGMAEVAESKGISLSDYLRSVLARALDEAGYTQAAWFQRKSQKKAQDIINDYHNGQSE